MVAANKAKKAKIQDTLVVVLALAFVLVSIFMALYLSGALVDMGSSDSKGYKNVTFTDALLTCKAEAKDVFDEDLSQLVVDNHSSRYDDRVSLYKIFIEVDIRGKKKMEHYFVNCYVRASNGRISEFESFEEREVKKGKAIQAESEKFIDWP
ncbi:MAG: hypothetical protein ACI93R_001438 [Flavobacteriales bacterium]|jgi:hypothetical protein